MVKNKSGMHFRFISNFRLKLKFQDLMERKREAVRKWKEIVEQIEIIREEQAQARKREIEERNRLIRAYPRAKSAIIPLARGLTSNIP